MRSLWPSVFAARETRENRKRMPDQLLSQNLNTKIKDFRKVDGALYRTDHSLV